MPSSSEKSKTKFEEICIYIVFFFIWTFKHLEHKFSIITRSNLQTFRIIKISRLQWLGMLD